MITRSRVPEKLIRAGQLTAGGGEDVDLELPLGLTPPPDNSQSQSPHTAVSLAIPSAPSHHLGKQSSGCNANLGSLGRRSHPKTVLEACR